MGQYMSKEIADGTSIGRGDRDVDCFSDSLRDLTNSLLVKEVQQKGFLTNLCTSLFCSCLEYSVAAATVPFFRKETVLEAKCTCLSFCVRHKREEQVRENDQVCANRRRLSVIFAERNESATLHSSNNNQTIATARDVVKTQVFVSRRTCREGSSFSNPLFVDGCLLSNQPPTTATTRASTSLLPSTTLRDGRFNLGPYCSRSIFVSNCKCKFDERMVHLTAISHVCRSLSTI